MTAVFVPIATQAAVDAAAASTAAEAAALGVAAAPVVAIVAAGAIVDYTLLNNKQWTGFWNHVGANVNDWYHSASDFLFGAAGVSLATVHGMVQLALHGANRLSRELFVQASVAAHAGLHVVAKYIDAIRADVHGLHARANALANSILTHYLQSVAISEHYVDLGLRRLLDDAKSLDTRVVHDVEAWVQRDIAAPLLREVGKVEGKVDGLVRDLGHIIDSRVGSIVNARVAGILATLAALGVTVASIATEIEQCVEPMCESFGPKSDLGQLLKRLEVAKWLAIIAALEATDVHDLEALAATVAGTEGHIGTWVGTHVLDELLGEHGA